MTTSAGKEKADRISAAAFLAGPVVVDSASAASGDAQVVAQGLAPFTVGEYHWVVETVPIASAASTIAVGGPTFVISDGPGGVLVGPGSAPPTWRLAAGERGLLRQRRTARGAPVRSGRRLALAVLVTVFVIIINREQDEAVVLAAVVGTAVAGEFAP